MVLRIEDLEIYRMAEEISDTIWTISTRWDNFSRNTIGKQLVRAADAISANLAEGHGRYDFKDKIAFCYCARGAWEEMKTWLAKADRRGLQPEGDANFTESLEIFPKKLNAYINSIKSNQNKPLKPKN
jgi:four helix bundle protein